MEIDVTKPWAELEKELGIKIAEIPKGHVVYVDDHELPVGSFQNYKPNKLRDLSISLNVFLYKIRKKLGCD